VELEPVNPPIAYMYPSYDIETKEDLAGIMVAVKLVVEAHEPIVPLPLIEA
jgi:hypothetical protein